MTIDPDELNYQYRRYRAATDAHFGGPFARYRPRMKGFRSLRQSDDPQDEEIVETMADYADAADHLRRFILRAARKMRLPYCEQDDIASDAVLEIVEALGRQQFEMLLQEIESEERIVDAFRGSARGLAARRAIKRVLWRSGFPQPTLTDVGVAS